MQPKELVKRINDVDMQLVRSRLTCLILDSAAYPRAATVDSYLEQREGF